MKFKIVDFLLLNQYSFDSPNSEFVPHDSKSRPRLKQVHRTRRPTSYQIQPRRTPNQIKTGSLAHACPPPVKSQPAHSPGFPRPAHTHLPSQPASRSAAIITIASSLATGHVTTFYDGKTSVLHTHTHMYVFRQSSLDYKQTNTHNHVAR